MSALDTIRNHIARGWAPVICLGTNHFIAFLPRLDPLGGMCLVCGGVMDETGCRIGDHLVNQNPVQARIAQVVEVFCAGVPAPGHGGAGT